MNGFVPFAVDMFRAYESGEMWKIARDGIFFITRVRQVVRGFRTALQKLVVDRRHGGGVKSRAGFGRPPPALRSGTLVWNLPNRRPTANNSLL